MSTLDVAPGKGTVARVLFGAARDAGVAAVLGAPSDDFAAPLVSVPAAGAAVFDLALELSNSVFSVSAKVAGVLLLEVLLLLPSSSRRRSDALLLLPLPPLLSLLPLLSLRALDEFEPEFAPALDPLLEPELKFALEPELDPEPELDAGGLLENEPYVVTPSPWPCERRRFASAGVPATVYSRYRYPLAFSRMVKLGVSIKVTAASENRLTARASGKRRLAMHPVLCRLCRMFMHVPLA